MRSAPKNEGVNVAKDKLCTVVNTYLVRRNPTRHREAHAQVRAIEIQEACLVVAAVEDESIDVGDGLPPMTSIVPIS